MTTYGIDYSWARPNPASIRQGGFVTVCRYLSRDRTGKALTKAEAGALLGAGLNIVLNFEDNERRPLGGFPAGVADAEFANTLADSLGAPGTAAIYYSIDTDLSYEQVRDYYRGIHSYGRRPAGAYGGGRVLNRLHAEELISYLWESNAESWNHGEHANPRHIKQLYGHPPVNTPVVPGAPASGYDINIIERADHGQWSTAPIPEETDLSWSKWNDLEKIDMVNQVAEEVARRMTGAPNIVTGKAFTPSLGDFTVIAITAITEAIKSIPGATADAAAIAKQTADEIAKRLAE